jgi:hypothetical protein
MRDLRAMTDEWRVEVNLDDERHGFTLGERLRSLDLDDEARERLGDRVIVTRDGPRMFLYARDEGAAKEAQRVAQELLAEEELSADVSLMRWHPDEERWEDASVPMPRTEEERAAEHARREAADADEAHRTGRDPWEVRVDLPSWRETLALAGRLSDEGIDARRWWRYLLLPAATQDQANDLADRVRREAPDDARVTVERSEGVPHPAFVFFGAHMPGIGRDLT